MTVDHRGRRGNCLGLSIEGQKSEKVNFWATKESKIDGARSHTSRDVKSSAFFLIPAMIKSI